MKVRRDEGGEMDAEFDVIEGVPLRITFESRGGGRNNDYIPALELLIARLAGLQATILEILISSRDALVLPWQERVLRMSGLSYPLRLDPRVDASNLRSAISAAQQRTARAPGAKGSGNPTKRIEVALSFDREVTADWLRRFLSEGVFGELPVRVSVHDRAQGLYSIYFTRSNIEAAGLPVGSVVDLDVGGAKVRGQIRQSETETWLATDGVPDWTYRRVTEELKGAGIQAPASPAARVLGVVGGSVGPTSDPQELTRRAGSLAASSGGSVGSDHPERVFSPTQTFVRDPAVVAAVLEAATGTCELCRQPAPFLRVNGQPYLEVHHVETLAEGGADRVENAVALCPNCHRLLHYGRDCEEAREQLFGLVPRLARPVRSGG